MKNMKNMKFILAIFFFCTIACNSQQILPLKTSDFNTPTNSYFKDLNNDLDFYIGTWKGNFQGKTVTVVITKDLKRPYESWGKNFFTDVLIVKYEVKDSVGNSLQSTLNNVYTVGSSVKNMIISATINLNSNNEVNLVYAGGNCSVGNGEITFKKIDNTHFYWSYSPGTAVMNDIDCPPGQDYHIYLPETENLLFTKQ